MNPKTMPKLTHGDIERKDLAGLAALLTSLAAAGATLFPDPDLENHIREEAGLPPAAEDGEGWGAPDPQEAANAAATATAMAAAGKPGVPQPGKPIPQNSAQPPAKPAPKPAPQPNAAKPASGSKPRTPKG